MIRLAARLTSALISLFALALTATHMMPPASPLTSLLMPSPGCSGSGLCFMGIYPGLTTIEQAVALLRAHPWVGAVDAHLAYQVSWTWSGAQPAFIDASVPGTIMERTYAYVTLIRFNTLYNYGDVWLQLGAPEEGYALRQPGGMLHGIYYPRHALLAINLLPCPARIVDFWRTPVAIQLGDAFVLLDRDYDESSVHLRTC